MGTVKQPRGGLDKAALTRLARVAQGRVTVNTAVIAVLYAGLPALALRRGGAVLTVLAVVVDSLIMSGFIQAAHDCVHASHLRSRAANRVMGAAWCTPILINFTNYRYQHLVHHRFTGVEGDTEPQKDFRTLGAYLHSMTGITIWRYNAITLKRTWQNRFPASVDKPERRRDSRQDNLAISCWLAAMIGLTFLLPAVLLVAYWLPLVLSTVISRFTGLPEHYGLGGVPEVERNTRTVRSNAVVRWFMWNANYHAEHHRYPAVPTLNLHRLHKALPDPHPIQVASYTGFHTRLLRELDPAARQPRETP